MRKFIQASVVVLCVAAPRIVFGQEVSKDQVSAPPSEAIQAPSANQPDGLSAAQEPAVSNKNSVAATGESSGAVEVEQSSGSNEAAGPPAAVSEASMEAQPSEVQQANASNSPTASVRSTGRGFVDDVNADALPFGHITLGLAFSALQRMDNGMQIFEGTNYAPQFVLNAGYDTAIIDRLRLGGELSWGITVASNDRYSGGNLAADALEHRALLSAIMSLALHPRFWPHVRLGGGFSAAKIHIDSDASGAGVNDWLLAPMAELAAGATFQWPVGRNAADDARAIRIGIRLEGGYAMVKKSSVSLTLPSDHSISTQLANLGSLHTGGVLLRIGLVVRF